MAKKISIISHYLIHLGRNLLIVVKAILLAMFHLAHAIVPIKYTDHEWWGIGLTEKKQSRLGNKSHY